MIFYILLAFFFSSMYNIDIINNGGEMDDYDRYAA